MVLNDANILCVAPHIAIGAVQVLLLSSDSSISGHVQAVAKALDLERTVLAGYIDNVSAGRRLQHAAVMNVECKVLSFLQKQLAISVSNDVLQDVVPAVELQRESQSTSWSTAAAVTGSTATRKSAAGEGVAGFVSPFSPCTHLPATLTQMYLAL